MNNLLYLLIHRLGVILGPGLAPKSLVLHSLQSRDELVSGTQSNKNARLGMRVAGGGGWVGIRSTLP